MARTSEYSFLAGEVTWVTLGAAGDLTLLETTAPGTVANTGQLYVKSSDSRLYYKDKNGNEYNVTVVMNRVVTLADGATPALDASLGNVFLLTAAGDRTIGIPTNPVSGQKIIIVHKASGANRTLSLNSGAGGFRFGTDFTALTATTSALTDYIGCIYNAADNKWDVCGYVKGF